MEMGDRSRFLARRNNGLLGTIAATISAMTNVKFPRLPLRLRRLPLFLAAHQHVRADLFDAVAASERHGDAELLVQDVDCLGDASLAAGAEAIDIRAADHAGVRSQR